MAYSEAQNRANQKYLKKAYDQIAIRVPKGVREQWKKAADDSGKSLAVFITEAVEEKIRKGE